MKPYVYEQHHRVALLTTLTNENAPTVAELNAGVVISAELARDGLDIRRTTNSVSRAKWRAQLAAEAPGKYRVAASLTGFRARPGVEAERLWGACSQYRSTGILVVRRGVLWSQPWAVGDVVEVLRFRWGKRSTLPSADNEAVKFSVPLLVDADADAAPVLA